MTLTEGSKETIHLDMAPTTSLTDGSDKQMNPPDSATAPLADTHATEDAEVRVLRNAQELEGIRDFWMNSAEHPNCDLNFYLQVVSSKATVLRPHVLVLFRGQQPEAVLVGRLDKGRVDFQLGYKRIFGLRARTLTFLHGGFMGERTPENCAMLLRSVVRSLAEGEAHVAYFNHIRTDEPLYMEMQKLADPHCRRSFTTPLNHRGMTLARSSEEFLGLLSSKERNNQKRRTKRLQEDFSGQVRLSCYRLPSDLETIVRDINEIAQKTYQRTLGVGFEDTPETRQQLRFALDRDWMRAYVLYLADRPCAFWMGNVYAKTFYSGFTGYDSVYSKYAPGMYLLLKALEQLCAENSDGRVRATDFGLGDSEWKLILGDLKWQEAPVRLFSPTARGLWLSLIHSATQTLDVAGKKALKRLQLIAHVKRLWRKRLRQDEKGEHTSQRKPS